jgi:hypothetical protein
VSKLEDEFRESPPYEIPHLTRYQVGPDYTTESRIHGDQHYVTVIGGAQCRDKLGFLLTRDGSGQNYDAAYNDGVVERINPIDGQPRPEPETADRTVGYKVPSQLRVAANSRVSASRFTGLMRLAVGCYHAAGKNAPFSFGFGKTHGILKFDVPVGNPAVMTPRYWVIEISSVGVFAAPIVNTGKCCDSWSITKYIPTAEEVAEQPSLEGFQTTLGLNWAFSVGRPGVLKLLSSTEMASAYSSGFPWYSGCGWAFSASGVSAQNVVVSSSSSPLPAHYLCSRFKISFSLQPNGTPAAAVTEEESNKIATFPEFSAVWIPTGSNNWFNSDFLTAFQIANMPFASQDAPVHVYYVGEQEIVTRWILTRSNQPLVLTPCTSNTLVQFLGTQRFCTEVYGSSVFSCQGINNFTIANPANPAIGMGDGGFKVSPDGNVKFGGSHTLTPAHSRVMAGFSSPHISTVFERSSKTVTETTTVQESPISGIYHNELVPPRLIPGEFTENPTNYMLDPSCYYTVNRPTFPFDPILITFCPVIEHYDETYALVYNRGFTGSENSSARTTVVPFLNEREALLHVYRNNQFRTGNDFTQSIVNDGQSYARLYSTRYKVADAASGIFPAGYLSCNYVGPWTAAGGSFFQSQGAFQSSLNPATTFGPNAAAQLNVGPLAVGAPVPSEATAGGFMPTTPLTVFVFGNFASPPAMIVEVASPVFAQHGNLYYDDPELEPTNQFGNAVYQLDSVVVTVGGFSDGATQYLAFVGKA